MMRAIEFIKEEDTHRMDATSRLKPEAAVAIRNAMIFPDQNMSTGSAYLHYRFGIALAGSPDYPTPPNNAIAGDPFLSAYTDEELEIVNAAAKMVGSKAIKRLSSNRSTELPDTNTTSPVPQNSGKIIKKKR
jgi:hypothetical protein